MLKLQIRYSANNYVEKKNDTYFSRYSSGRDN